MFIKSSKKFISKFLLSNIFFSFLSSFPDSILFILLIDNTFRLTLWNLLLNPILLYVF